MNKKQTFEGTLHDIYSVDANLIIDEEYVDIRDLLWKMDVELKEGMKLKITVEVEE